MTAEYDSRDSRFKTPFGASAALEPVHFFIKAPDALSASLAVRPDGENEFLIGMSRSAQRGGFSCVFTPGAPGLYWYRFVLEFRDGHRSFGRGACGKAAECGENGPFFQLTVYSPDFTTPDFIKGGVIYQIFPDRFRREGPMPDRYPSGRVLRSDWGGTPEYLPDPRGKILNDDFFCGNLRGIIASLPYLSQLGVTALYLNPIFEAASNHRYDTGDYMNIDPLLGTEEDFRHLCSAAKSCGMSVILDGVFNHTGDDSVYFNRRGRYPVTGAYQSKSSPYFGWYDFTSWPDKYSAWWGIETLPAVREDSGFTELIAGGGGVLEHWTRAGASGWRLDVADELTEPFIKRIRHKLKSENPDALIIGEVWEDASNKISYGERRHYFAGDELDGVMDYPLRNAVIDFVKGGDGAALDETIMSILENYPPQCADAMMNILGTHDTERLITVLAGDSGSGRDANWKAAASLSPQQYRTGVRLVTLASAIQFCLPGVPCIYYGDEAGMQGYGDPFNRRCFPWGAGEPRLGWWYGQLSRIRGACPALKKGRFVTLEAQHDFYAFMREDGRDRLVCAVNTGADAKTLSLPHSLGQFMPVDGLSVRPCGNELEIPAGGCRIFGSGKWISKLRR
jgi:cyclomaltodextrinase / maltogenic alpha-amylase / neopullulanase